MNTLRKPSFVHSLLFACAMAMPCSEVQASSFKPWKSLLTLSVVCCAMVSGQQGQKLQGEEMLALEENYGFAGAQRTFSEEGDDARYLVYENYDVVNGLLGDALGPLGGANITFAPITTLPGNNNTGVLPNTPTSLPPGVAPTKKEEDDPVHTRLEFILPMSIGIPCLFLYCCCIIASKKGKLGENLEQCSKGCAFGERCNTCWYERLCCCCKDKCPGWLQPHESCKECWNICCCTAICTCICNKILCYTWCKQPCGFEDCYKDPEAAARGNVDLNDTPSQNAQSDGDPTTDNNNTNTDNNNTNDTAIDLEVQENTQ